MAIDYFDVSKYSMTYIADWTQKHGYDLDIDQLNELYYHLQCRSISEGKMALNESEVFTVIHNLFGESVPVLAAQSR